MDEGRLPLPTGPYAVGRTSFDLVDSGRIVTHAASGENSPRALVVWVWYPAAGGGLPGSYYPAGWEASDSIMGMPLGMSSLGCHSLDGAQPDLSGSPYPVLLFSASGFSPLSYAATVEDLASRGYVVVSISHTYEAPVTVFGDGRAVYADPEYLAGIVSTAGEYRNAFAFREGVALTKRDDLAFVAGALEETAGPLAGMLDFSRLGAFGHSLGGNAAFEFCRTDIRCRAAVNLDGALWSRVGLVGLAKPALTLAAEHPEMILPPEAMVAAGAYPNVEWCLAERAVLWDGWKKVEETGASRITIEGAKHANFADVGFVDMPADSVLRNVVGSIDPVEMWQRTTEALGGFFGEHLPRRP